MPIDASQVKWDAPDPKAVVWDAPAGKPSFMQSLGREALNSIPVQSLFGAARGIGGIGATVGMQGDDGRKAVENKLVGMGANPESLSYQGGKLASEVGVTWPIGGVLAQGAAAIPRVAQAAPSLINALRTSGMTTGAAPVGFAAKAGDLALRTGAGAAVGGASAAATGDSAGTGAMIGGALPGAFKAAGLLGGGIGSVVGKIRDFVTGSKAGAGESLVAALGGLSKEEVKALADAAAKMPGEIVPGSKLTFAQALELAGQSNPNVQMLERAVSQGAGGGALLKRYGEQAGARIAALEGQGAQVYQGAAREEANQAGNMLGARLRTQVGDEALGNQSNWNALTAQAQKEGTAIQYPIDASAKVMAERFPPGSVAVPKEANSVLATMRAIGLQEVPAVAALSKPGKVRDLAQEVRAMGGIRPQGYLAGEIKLLTNRESGTSGLVSAKGKSVDELARAMKERGFIQSDDPAELLNALRNNPKASAIGADNIDNVYAGYARRGEAAMGDAPAAEAIPKAVPFNSFQATRRDAGTFGANVAEKDANHAAALGQIEKLLAGRVDDAAAGNLLPGESMTPGFRDAYVQARDATRGFHDRYSQANNVSDILKKPYGGTYSLNGDEIFNKVWHGGSGLQQDVANIKGVLNHDNSGSVLEKLRRAVLTDAASKTTAGGDLAAALPAYVENRMPGLRELLDPDQFSALTNTAKDIRNATAAQNVSGLVGSSTYANISKALDAGVLDSTTSKALARMLSWKTGIGGETVRRGLADSVIKGKGSAIAELLADPKTLQKALEDATPTGKSKLRELLASPEAQQLMYRLAPISGQ